MDMVFDNIVTDMRVRQQLAAQLQDVKLFSGEVAQARAWVAQWTAQIASDYASIDGEQRMRKGQLDAHRRRLLEQLLAAQATV